MTEVTIAEGLLIVFAGIVCAVMGFCAGYAWGQSKK